MGQCLTSSRAETSPNWGQNDLFYSNVMERPFKIACFVNSFCDVGFKAWQANMDVQPVFSEYKAVECRCQYFSKTEYQCSQAMKQAANEAFGNIVDHDTMSIIAKVYLNNRDCSVQEVFYYILIELKLM